MRNLIKKPISRRSFIKISTGTAGLLALGNPFTQAFAQNDPITIQFWHSHGGGLGELLETFVEEFNALDNNITVQSEYQGDYQDHMNKLIIAAAGNALPDMIHLGDGQYPPLAQNNLLQPLDDFMGGEYGIDLSEYTQPVYRGMMNDQFYQLAYGVSTPILYYNVEAITAAGLDGAPDTWDDFFDTYLPALTSNGMAGFAYAPGNWWQQAAYWSNGAMQEDENWLVDLANPAAITWFERMQSARQQGHVLYPSASADNGSNGLFASQYAAITINSTGLIGTIDELSQGAFTANVDFLPAGPGGRFVPSGGNGLSIIRNASPEAQLAAWRFITYLQSPDQFMRYDERSGYIPITQPTIERMQDILTADPRRQVAVEQFEFSRWHMKVHTLARAAQAMQDAWNEVVQTDTDVSKRLNKLQDEVVQIVREEGFEPTFS